MSLSRLKKEIDTTINISEELKRLEKSKIRNHNHYTDFVNYCENKKRLWESIINSEKELVKNLEKQWIWKQISKDKILWKVFKAKDKNTTMTI